MLSVIALGSVEFGRLTQSIENVLLLAGTLVCLVYFFFSVEHKGTMGRLSRMGIWVLMITFGPASATR